MKRYYLHNGSENIGPFDLEDLRRHQITKDAPIWYEGIEDWKNAGEIEELKSILIVVPPAFIRKDILEGAILDSPSTTAKKKKSSLAWRTVKIFLFALLSVLSIVFIMSIIDRISSNQSPEPYPIEMTVREKEVMFPTGYLDAGGSYKPNFLGEKLKIDGYIENNATLTTYKDIVIEITYYSKTNTPLRTVYHTVYEFIPPSSKKSFQLKIENYNNIESLGWKVYNAGVK